MTTTEQELQQCDVTLDDIYKAFGKQKKHYATRLKHAFLEHHIETIDVITGSVLLIIFL